MRAKRMISSMMVAVVLCCAAGLSGHAQEVAAVSNADFVAAKTKQMDLEFPSLMADVQIVSTEDQLRSAVENGGDIEIALNQSIVLSGGRTGIEITGGRSVTIDLGGHTLTGAAETYAIRAVGSTLIVKNGTITVDEWYDSWSYGIDNRGSKVTVENVIFTSRAGQYAGDAVTANWNDGTPGTTFLKNVTVESGFDWGVTAYNDSQNVLTIEGGSYQCDITAEGGTVNINGGDFTGKVLNQGYMNISGGTIRRIEDASEDKTLQVTGGDFSQVTEIRKWVVPEGSNLDIVLNNATIFDFSLQGGKLSGTVGSLPVSEKAITVGKNAYIAPELVESINYLIKPGMILAEQTDGSYQVIPCETVTVTVESENTALGNVAVKKGPEVDKNTYTKNITVNKGTTVTVALRSFGNEDYTFGGWYIGEKFISAQESYTFATEETATYTAKFTISAAVEELRKATEAWLYEDGTTLKSSYEVSSMEEMNYLAFAVNKLGQTFAGITVNLTADLDYTGMEYTPVGDKNHRFAGIFDGSYTAADGQKKNHKISGVVLNGDDYIGIFGNQTGEIRNLDIEGCSVTGREFVGVLAGEGRTITNCHVTNSYVEGVHFVGIIVGHSSSLNADTVSVTNCEIQPGWKSGGIAGYADNCKISNAIVSELTFASEDIAGGSLVGHINYADAVLTNIKVNTPEYRVIGTTYSSPNNSITITGDETEIYARTIIDQLTDVSDFIIDGGRYELSENVIQSEENITGQGIVISGGTFTRNPNPEWISSDSIGVPNQNGEYIIVSDHALSTVVTVAFEQGESESQYNIVLYPQPDKSINRLMSAELAFALDTTDDIAYEITGAPKVNVTTREIDGKTGYLFYFNGVDLPSASGEKVVLGTVTFTGFGTAAFRVDSAYAQNIVNTAEISDNIITQYIPNGDGMSQGQLIFPDDALQLDLKVKTHILTVHVTFNNAIEDHSAAYQDMKAVISGGDLQKDIEISFGFDDGAVALVDNVYTFSQALTQDMTYQVTVSGSGYRTARYTVRMTQDKELNFWNNVKDQAAEVTTGVSATKNFLAGDIIMDNVINLYDLSAVVSYFGQEGINVEAASNYAQYDLNRDGKIDSKDVAMVLVSWEE